MKVIIALLSAALLIWLSPTTQATPAHLNNVERTTKVATVKNPVRTVAPRKEPEQTTQVQAKPKPLPQPVQQTIKTAAKPVEHGCDAYRSTFAQYQWNVRMALAICKAESGGNVYAHSSTGDRGLMQINYVHADKVDYDLSALYNPYTNIRVAYRVYLSQGWNGWSTYKNQSYLKFY